MISNLPAFFKALSDQTRQRIINLLLHHSALNVNVISEILEVPQSNISRHLSVLRNAGWIIFNRRDKWIYYKLNPKLDKQFLEVLKKMFGNQLELEADVKRAEQKL